MLREEAMWKRDLQQPHVQPLQDVRAVELSVGGSDRRLQDPGQVVLVQRGGGARQLGPETSHTHTQFAFKSLYTQIILKKCFTWLNEKCVCVCVCSLQQVHQMSNEVSLAQQQVSPHGLQVLQQLVVLIQHVQQVLTGLEVRSVDLTLERPLQVCEQLGR